jgi:hypothetical protein
MHGENKFLLISYSYVLVRISSDREKETNIEGNARTKRRR